MVMAVAGESEPAVAIVRDDEQHQAFERIDAGSRWAGVAVVDAHLLGSTAVMLGDWDLQSTLLRRTIQEGARRVPAAQAGGEPLLVGSADQLADFQRNLVRASRGSRTDWASRFVLAPLEDFATEQLMEPPVRPAWLIWTAIALTIVAAVSFTRPWLPPRLALLLFSTPLALISCRLAT